ncbi:MAG: DUF2478 domain-containing protein [Rhodospirillaceae bacterium]|nr:DUF2478 domain-containing protein [Rhodospirillaceae bacterium]MBT3887013.1 DUF2478 domain-containing protein [Rhodospirillaceae bacterium]MBT4118048.1 DUF2478 domain-containing protein [Rhodospirillaceae bacterium]MBT4671115.1 DUF2478 domain-containing protein [Rhodospirillaceae bacterium]MBT5177919.1 DUF2478 domain-containing protein [Rhodospirillaceae bacterium]
MQKSDPMAFDAGDKPEEDGPAAFAAVVYTPKQTDKSTLPAFVRRLKSEQVSVAGILQESRLEDGAETRTIDSVDIRTGQRIAIKRPMASEDECGLDVASLVETSAILRGVLQSHPDLVVIEKFGDQEQEGEGLLDEIMQIISEGIPLMITVPEPALEIWQRQCGGLGAVLPYSEDAMLAWWRALKP